MTSTTSCRIGYRGKVAFQCPATYHHEAVDADTSLLMPMKNDPEGPVSQRISLLSEHPDLLDGAEQKVNFLKKCHPELDVFPAGKNFFVMEQENYKDDDGWNWNCIHSLIAINGALCTSTIQIIQGRESDPQVGEIRDGLPIIVESMLLID
jgi:hypothetical protein